MNVLHLPRLAGRGLIKAYRYTLSPLVGFHCRHLPTCSEYADEALDRYGLWAGGWMTLARLTRCQPWGTSGIDRVPEIAMLTKRSEELIAQGDIAAARLMLTRAAEAGDARAALVLGATYDSVMLRKLGVLGVAPDVALARAWYGKAAEYGSGEATVRLEQLAQSVP